MPTSARSRKSRTRASARSRKSRTHTATYHLYKSTDGKHKYYVTDGYRAVYFGAVGYSDYTIHHDESRKSAYDKRHSVNEHWRDPTTAGFWSKWILWNLPSLHASIAATEKKFNIRIVSHL